jgi:hypothetical protein
MVRDCHSCRLLVGGISPEPEGFLTVTYIPISEAGRRIVARLTVEQHKQDKKTSPLYPVWVVAKFWGHGGYQWYAVTNDGELLCAECVRKNYRQIVESTRDHARDGWRVVGVTYSGEMEENEPCAHCGLSIGPELLPNLEDN